MAGPSRRRRQESPALISHFTPAESIVSAELVQPRERGRERKRPGSGLAGRNATACDVCNKRKEKVSGLSATFDFLPLVFFHHPAGSAPWVSHRGKQEG